MFEVQLSKLSPLLDADSLTRLKNSAEAAQRVETKWDLRVSQFWERKTREVINSLEITGRVPELGFEDLVIGNYFDAAKTGYESAYSREYTRRRLPEKAKASGARMARPTIPRKLADLMKLWDLWRRKKHVPRRQKEIAEKIERAYRKRVQSVWEKYSRDFRAGEVWTQKEVVDGIARAGEVATSTAQRIVREETTRYYNEARRKVYDESADVTHYLYVAIRDHATTKWCRDRHRLVYSKDSKYLEEETPPNHWNCRSEILPLTPKNPVHLRLINDRGLRRENRRPEPLPKEFKKRVA